MEHMRILLYSDGSAVGDRALDLGKQIALATESVVDILAIAEHASQMKEVHQRAETVAEELQESDTPVTVRQRPGRIVEEMIDQAHVTIYDLIVLGGRSRRGIKWLLADSQACEILGHVTTSILVVKGRRRERIRDILICSSAGPSSEDTVRFAARLAHALDASVTLLHVMSQVALEVGARAADLEEKADGLMESEAREGVHLDDMLEILREEGVEAEALVRHGLIVEEIIAEARSGRFDMLVIGAHTTPGIGDLLSSDLSERIMLSADRPILIVQRGQGPAQGRPG